MLGRSSKLEEDQMTIFPTKILRATDGSGEAQFAARTAVDLARKTDSELHVVHVLDTAAGVALLYPEAREPKRVESVALLYPEAADAEGEGRRAPPWEEEIGRAHV